MTQITSNSAEKKGQYFYNGQYINARKDGNGWFVVIDGKRINLNEALIKFKTNDLTSVPQHFVDYYTKGMKTSEEKRKNLKSEENMLTERLKLFKKNFSAFLAKNNVTSLDELTGAKRAEATKMLSSISGVKKLLNANGMSFMSECMKAFDMALSKGSWQNQLSLAQHVMSALK